MRTSSPIFRVIAYTVLTAFAGMLPVSPSYAQVAIIMPPPGQMIHITRHFEPPQMVGLKVNLKDPFSFDFIMDQGEKPMSADIRKQEFNKIIKYFLVSLAMPNTDMWVNLSPYESKRIIPEVFAQTEMGRDLLAQDYILKQFTASLMYPEDGLGKKFWDNVYAQAHARFGTTDISVNTFNKVWIVADHADVYQKGDTAFLVGSHLKVMLEQDYMAIEKHKEMFGTVQAVNETNDAKTQMASQLVREIIIPAIEKEVNEGKSFAAVRQVYNAEIMATWFKKTLKQSLLGQVFANKSKIAGQRVKDPQAEEKIYQQYLSAYKKGVFNYVKQEATPDGQIIPRKYFSGGMKNFDSAMLNVLTDPSSAVVHDFAQTAAAKFRGGRLFVTAAALLITVGGLTFSTSANAQKAKRSTSQTFYFNTKEPSTHLRVTINMNDSESYTLLARARSVNLQGTPAYKKFLNTHEDVVFARQVLIDWMAKEDKTQGIVDTNQVGVVSRTYSNTSKEMAPLYKALKAAVEEAEQKAQEEEARKDSTIKAQTSLINSKGKLTVLLRDSLNGQRQINGRLVDQNQQLTVANKQLTDENKKMGIVQQSLSEQKKDNRWLRITLAAVVAALGIGGWFYKKKRDKELSQVKKALRKQTRVPEKQPAPLQQQSEGDTSLPVVQVTVETGPGKIINELAAVQNQVRQAEEAVATADKNDTVALEQAEDALKAVQNDLNKFYRSIFLRFVRGTLPPGVEPTIGRTKLLVSSKLKGSENLDRSDLIVAQGLYAISLQEFYKEIPEEEQTEDMRSIVSEIQKARENAQTAFDHQIYFENAANKLVVDKYFINKFSDSAMTTGLPVDKNVGGINLSDENLVMNFKVDSAGMPLPVQFQNKAMMNLKGLTSIIRKITPLTPENVPALYQLLQ